MLKMKILLTMILSISLTGIGVIFADEPEFTIWVPDEMLPNEIYHGVLISESKKSANVDASIVTNNEEVIEIISKAIKIDKENQHGIFEFKTKGVGDATIFAIQGDQLLEREIKVVHSAKLPYALDLILPSEVINIQSNKDEQTGYVFLLNNFENPVLAVEPTLISLTSNGEITLPQNSIMIEPGKHYEKFTFQIRGEGGEITATAANLKPDDEEVSSSQTEKIELKLAVAPDPIPTDSSGELYYWLERNGKPFLAPHDLRIKLSIDDTTKLSFESTVRGTTILTANADVDAILSADDTEVITRTEVQLQQDAKRSVFLDKGVHYGKIKVWTTADSSGMSISGLAESIDSDVEEKISIAEVINVESESSNSDVTTKTKVFAFPNPAYDFVDIIISSESGNGPVIEPDDEEVTVFTDSKLITESPKSKILMDENYAIITARVVDLGDAEIFAERNDAESDRIEIEVEEKFVNDPKLEIQPLPALYGIEQELFLITSSHDIITTDPTSQNEGTLLSVTTKPYFEFESIAENESIITVRGTIENLSEDSEESPEIFVASNAETVTEKLEVHNSNRKTIITMAPETVYPDELFPFVTHIGDLEKNPIQKEELKFSSNGYLEINEGLGWLNGTEEIKVVFFDENSVPESTQIEIKGGEKNKSKSPTSSENSVPTRTIFTYDVEVENGEGSGQFPEGEEITISAEPIIDDFIIIKKQLVGWENLPNTDSSFIIEIEEDIKTRPIYQYDFTLLLLTVAPAIGIVSVVTVKKQLKKKTNKKIKNFDDDVDIDELFD
ncbi:hypothetical protein [Nitrosopumilus sp.]|uniref:hypothetical protein n=1 Tax=Nitrosopumilus sp. TaxID=2024843 RepID=UPI00262748DD|nr:hypothetical protein [Nitrosopumilus sp.]